MWLSYKRVCFPSSLRRRVALRGRKFSPEPGERDGDQDEQVGSYERLSYIEPWKDQALVSSHRA